MPRFEYKRIDRMGDMSELELDRLGLDGWELCGVRDHTIGPDTAFYFKRRRPEMVLK